jgi:hypothetical protein
VSLYIPECFFPDWNALFRTDCFCSDWRRSDVLLSPLGLRSVCGATDPAGGFTLSAHRLPDDTAS